MKKAFEHVEIKLIYFKPTDIIVTSVYIEWDDTNWNGSGSDDYIFG